MSEIQISINGLSKVYDNGFKALNNVSLKVKQGEILAMLGPNGAGKTSLISIICGIVKPSSGTVTIDNFDIIKDYRETRSRIGLVPQELNLESFETVFDTVSYSRGLYGKAPKPEHIEKILKDLSLWDKKDQRLRQLSGGMKRRVLIAKALSHEPKILFLDEQHLEEALKIIFRFNRPGGLRRNQAPELVGLSEQVINDRYALCLVFDSPKMEFSDWTERLGKITGFFGPGVVAAATQLEGSKVEIALITTGSGGGGEMEDMEVLPPLMPGLPARYVKRGTA